MQNQENTTIPTITSPLSPSPPKLSPSFILCIHSSIKTINVPFFSYKQFSRPSIWVPLLCEFWVPIKEEFSCDFKSIFFYCHCWTWYDFQVPFSYKFPINIKEEFSHDFNSIFLLLLLDLIWVTSSTLMRVPSLHQREKIFYCHCWTRCEFWILLW